MSTTKVGDKKSVFEHPYKRESMTDQLSRFFNDKVTNPTNLFRTLKLRKPHNSTEP